MGFVILALIALGIAACGVSVSKSTDVVRDVVFPAGNNDETIVLTSLRIPADQAASIDSLIYESGTLTVHTPSTNFNAKNIRVVTLHAFSTVGTTEQWITLYDRSMQPTTSMNTIDLSQAAGQDFTSTIKMLTANGDAILEAVITYAGGGPPSDVSGTLSITLAGNVNVL